jgi:hypothetical protein
MPYEEEEDTCHMRRRRIHVTDDKSTLFPLCNSKIKNNFFL